MEPLITSQVENKNVSSGYNNDNVNINISEEISNRPIYGKWLRSIFKFLSLLPPGIFVLLYLFSCIGGSCTMAIGYSILILFFIGIPLIVYYLIIALMYSFLEKTGRIDSSKHDFEKNESSNLSIYTQILIISLLIIQFTYTLIHGVYKDISSNYSITTNYVLVTLQIHSLLLIIIIFLIIRVVKLIRIIKIRQQIVSTQVLENNEIINSKLEIK